MWVVVTPCSGTVLFEGLLLSLYDRISKPRSNEGKQSSSGQGTFDWLAFEVHTNAKVGKHQAPADAENLGFAVGGDKNHLRHVYDIAGHVCFDTLASRSFSLRI